MTSETNTIPHDHPLVFKEESRLARVIIANAPRRNAISREMLNSLLNSYQDWVKNPDIYMVLVESSDPNFFSAGADMRELYQASQQSPDIARDMFKEEYENIWAIECYTKPLVAFVNGVVIGGGIGITQYGTHIVAGENFAWSMPEVKIGLFPDIAITHLLAKMPNSIGFYLGLTGRTINRSDAFFLGLTEHCIDENQFSGIREKLREAEPVDALLDGLHQTPGSSELETRAPIIDEMFSKPSIEEIFDGLEQTTGSHEAWAKETLDHLREASPLSLKVTFEAMKRAKTMQMDEALAQDYTLVQHFLTNSDLMEGVRAKLIEKRPPQWSAAHPKEISAARVAEFFVDPGISQLNLPPRELGLDK